jgi:tetratricopeptide (TPR) repeat protein
VLRRLADYNPYDATVLNTLAWRLRLTDPVQALRYAERAVELAPKSARAAYTYADVLARNQQKELALRTIDHAIENHSSNPVLKLRRAEIYRLVDEPELAEKELRTLIASDAPQEIKDGASALLQEWGN